MKKEAEKALEVNQDECFGIDLVTPLDDESQRSVVGGISFIKVDVTRRVPSRRIFRVQSTTVSPG